MIIRARADRGSGERSGSDWLRRAGREVASLDRAVSEAVATTSTPALDGPISRLSNAANGGWLWLAVAAVVALVGGRRGRRSALRALLALGVASATANVAVKGVARRRRPQRPGDAERGVAMPSSSSFPSGHTASAFSFATAMTSETPWLALPLFGVASLVGYSRVHAGVHYPSDVIAGCVLGLSVGTLVREVTLRAGPLASSSGVHHY